MVRQTRATAALVGDQSLILTTCDRWHITTYNSSSRQSGALFWTLWMPSYTCITPPTHTHTHGADINLRKVKDTIHWFLECS